MACKKDPIMEVLDLHNQIVKGLMDCDLGRTDVMARINSAKSTWDDRLSLRNDLALMTLGSRKIMNAFEFYFAQTGTFYIFYKGRLSLITKSCKKAVIHLWGE